MSIEMNWAELVNAFICAWRNTERFKNYTIDKPDEICDGIAQVYVTTRTKPFKHGVLTFDSSKIKFKKEPTPEDINNYLVATLVAIDNALEPIKTQNTPSTTAPSTHRH
jgi:hypothetical protein